MRITFLTGRYWPANGGVETLVHHVANTLAGVHEVTVLTRRIDNEPRTRRGVIGNPPAFDPFFDGGARIVQLRAARQNQMRMLPVGLQALPGFARFAYGRMRVPLAATYARAMQDVLLPYFRDADIVHVWSPDLLGAAGLRAARAAGRPCVITPFVHPGQWGEDPASVRVYKRADRVIGLLDTERPVLEGLGVPKERIAVCGACTPGVRRGAGVAVRQQHKISGPLILFLGVRRPYKGYDLLLRAADRVCDVHPDAVFAFVGPGEPLSTTQTRARIIDVGKADDAGVAGWLEAADIMCLPSAHEIFPTSVLEAFSASTPVLLSDLPPLRELVTKSGGGEVTQRTPDDIATNLLRMLAAPARLKAAAAAGHDFWASHYTPQAVAAQHERLYEDLLGDGEQQLARGSSDLLYA